MTDRLTRRQILQAGSMAAAATTAALPSRAEPAEDYKALVCIMLKGGLDAHDCLVPTDEEGYKTWRRARRVLLDGASGESRDRTVLTPLDAGGQAFGFVPELAPLARLYGEGKVAVVPNVGPLLEPANRRLVQDKKVQLPPRLGSHNDQRSVWESLHPEGARAGWGGLLADAVVPGARFATVSVYGNALFTAGVQTKPLVMGTRKVPLPFGVKGKAFGSPQLSALLREHYQALQTETTNILYRDVAAQQARSVEDYLLLSETFKETRAADAVVVPGNRLSNQLATTAGFIANREGLGLKRQVFYAAIGGFDTHARQMSLLPPLQAQMAEAVFSFQRALESMGVAEQVTTIVITDFGRTLVSNRTGTDHGWGGHSYVIGGAVKPGVHGEIPPSEEHHDYDWGRGALIPRYSIEQYGASLGRWFGVSEPDLRNVFPLLERFDVDELSLFG